MADESRAIAAQRVSRWYLLGEIVLVLAIGTILLKAVPARFIFESVWGRLYLPVRASVQLGFIAWLLSLTGRTWQDMGVRRPASWRRSTTLGIGAFVVMFLATQTLRRALAALGLPSDGDVRLFAAIEGNVWEYLYWALPVSILVGAISEEFIGRAYLISRVAAMIGEDRRLATVVAVVFAGVLMGLAHAYQGIGGMITTGTLGLLSGMLYFIAGRNIWPAVIAHGLTDVFGFTMIFLGAADLGGG